MFTSPTFKYVNAIRIINTDVYCIAAGGSISPKLYTFSTNKLSKDSNTTVLLPFPHRWS